MRWKDYFQSASVRQYAMIGASFPLTAQLIWIIHREMEFLDGKPLTTEQFFQLTKLQLQFLGFQGYGLLLGILLIVVALTLTKFSAVTKLGSIDVGGQNQDIQDQPENKVVKQNGDGTP